MIGQAHMKEASRFLDDELIREEQLKNTLLAYSEMGHALRPLVSATGYASAAKALELTKNDPGISVAVKKHIDHALRALYSFEHVEAFGSLLRLSTWLGSADQRVEQLRKLRKCFDPETVEAVRRGDHDPQVLAGYVELVARLARGLASTFKVTFRVSSSHPALPESMKIAPDDPPTYRALAEVDLPPLTTSGDRTSVVLTMVTALLEPLRNAASYLNQHPQGGAPVDVVIALRMHGSCSIFIGNPLLDADRSTRGSVDSIPGVRLTKRLLENTMIGSIREPSDEESESLSLNRSMIWICVDFTPLRLFEGLLLE